MSTILRFWCRLFGHKPIMGIDSALTGTHIVSWCGRCGWVFQPAEGAEP